MLFQIIIEKKRWCYPSIYSTCLSPISFHSERKPFFLLWNEAILLFLVASVVIDQQTALDKLSHKSNSSSA